MISLDPGHLLKLRVLAGQAQREQGATTLPGGLVVRARGRGLETADLRAFAYGDDPRHIDRNATARTGQLQVRNFHAERDRTTLLLADFRPSMLWGTRRTFRSIAAAEALAVAGWRAVLEGGRVGLIAISAGQPVFVSARGRDRGMVAVIGGLVRAHRAALGLLDTPDPPLQDTLELAIRVAPRGASVVLATGLDTLGSDFKARSQALGRRTTLSVIRVLDAFETNPPTGRYRFRTVSGRNGMAPAPPSSMAVNLPDVNCREYHSAWPPDQQPAVA